MSDTAKKQVRKLKIIEDDPNLSAFESDLNERVRHFKQRKKELLAPGQTLGLYTATGWQFWINGSKRGWFDSEDGMLHVANIVVEDKLQIGDGWLMTTTGGFGLRYTGG